MRLSNLIRAVMAIPALLAVWSAAPAQSPWQQPAADLAAQIATILGHGTARLIIRDLSSLSVDEIPAIRKLLEQDLRGHGIIANSAPNETIIRVTLSESGRGFTWVAEVIRGDDTQIAVVDLPTPAHPFPMIPRAEMILRRVSLYESRDPILGGFEFENEMVLLTPHAIKHEVLADNGWEEQHNIPIPPHQPLDRDPRGLLLPTAQQRGFEAWLPGLHCTGSLGYQANQFTIDCHPGDDLWPLTVTRVTPSSTVSSPTPNTPLDPLPAQTAPLLPQFRAFYNTARDYFTGVVAPSLGVDLPPFYSAANVPWKTPDALVIGMIDGKILLADSGKIITLNGTSDWGSDFATIRYPCGAGLPIVSGAGDSNADTLRAYEITGTNVEPRSAPLAIDGTVTALWTAPDGKSVYAVIRNAQNEYEVDRVTALCN